MTTDGPVVNAVVAAEERTLRIVEMSEHGGRHSADHFVSSSLGPRRSSTKEAAPLAGMSRRKRSVRISRKKHADLDVVDPEARQESTSQVSVENTGADVMPEMESVEAGDAETKGNSSLHSAELDVNAEEGGGRQKSQEESRPSETDNPGAGTEPQSTMSTSSMTDVLGDKGQSFDESSGLEPSMEADVHQFARILNEHVTTSELETINNQESGSLSDLPAMDKAAEMDSYCAQRPSLASAHELGLMGSEGEELVDREKFERLKRESYKALCQLEAEDCVGPDKIHWHIGRLLSSRTLGDLEPYPLILLEDIDDGRPSSDETKRERLVSHLEHYRLFFLSSLSFTLSSLSATQKQWQLKGYSQPTSAMKRMQRVPKLTTPHLPASFSRAVGQEFTLPNLRSPVDWEDQGSVTYPESQKEVEAAAGLLTETLMHNSPMHGGEENALMKLERFPFKIDLDEEGQRSGYESQHSFDDDQDGGKRGMRRGRPPVACTCRFCGMKLSSRGELTRHERKAHGRGRGVKRLRMEGMKSESDDEGESDEETKKQRVNIRRRMLEQSGGIPVSSPVNSDEPRRRGRPRQAVICDLCGKYLPSRVEFTMHLRTSDCGKAVKQRRRSLTTPMSMDSSSGVPEDEGVAAMADILKTKLYQIRSQKLCSRSSEEQQADSPPLARREENVETPSADASFDDVQEGGISSIVGGDSREPVEIVREPFGVEPEPYGVEPGDFGVEPGDFGVEPGDFGVEPGDFGVEPEPFEVEPEPFEVGREPFEVGREPFGAPRESMEISEEQSF